MTSKDELKWLILKEHLTVEKLANKLSDKTGRHYTQRSLQVKIFKSSFRYDEMEEIAQMLGYEIKIEKNRDKKFVILN